MGVTAMNGFNLINHAIVFHYAVYRYLHNKQRKRRHYSQHVEDGTDAIATAGKETSLSRVTFGVLW